MCSLVGGCCMCVGGAVGTVWASHGGGEGGGGGGGGGGGEGGGG